MPLFQRRQPMQAAPNVRAQGQMVTSRGKIVPFAPVADAVQPNFLKRLMTRWTRANHQPPDTQTTEMGASGAASPTNQLAQFYQLRYERRELLYDVNLMAREDPRANRATWMFAREACRGGFTIVGSNAAQRGKSRQMARQAEEVFTSVSKLLLPKLSSLGWSQIVEGDLFIQAVISGDRIVDLKRMPACGMERRTDERDNFADPYQAYEQVDVETNQTIDTFPQAVIWHGRWKHVDGERYGNSEIASGRRLRKIVELQEESQSIRRMVRAAMTRVWNVEGKEGFGTPEEVMKFKEDNFYVEGKQEPFNPYNAARDHVGNGGLKCEAIAGDAGVSDVDDLKYFQNTYTSAALPTPAPLYNLDAEAVNRDVLEEVMGQWLNETTELSDLLEGLVRWAVDLGLLLQGILPETVSYSVKFAESSIEKPQAIVDRILKAYGNTVGLGNNSRWEPLLDKKTAMQKLAPFLGIDDVDAVLAAIEVEQQKRQEQDAQQAQQQIQAEAEGENDDNGEDDDTGNTGSRHQPERAGTGRGAGNGSSASARNKSGQRSRNQRDVHRTNRVSHASR